MMLFGIAVYYWFSMCTTIDYWERSTRITKYNCGFVYFSLQFSKFLFNLFLKHWCQIHTHLGLLCRVIELTIFQSYHSKLYLWYIYLYDINIFTPVFFWLVFAWYISFKSFDHVLLHSHIIYSKCVSYPPISLHQKCVSYS